MTELYTAPGSPAGERLGAGPSYAAVGIPQGIIVDRANGEMAGGVRRGGELVSLDSAEYGLWTILLTPMTATAVTAAVPSHDWSHLDQSIARLRELDLLVTIEPGKSMGSGLERLRALPLGVGMGNSTGDPDRFEIQNATLSLPVPVSLDVVAVMFWWEFDGTRSLREIAERVAARIPGMSIDLADAVVTQLAYGLMASRLMYLDYPVPRGE